jgi:Zn-finger domain-containing protein
LQDVSSGQDSKRIAREWNREIEDEIRREAARADDGPWRMVVWGVLWFAWLAVILVAIGLFNRLQ